MNRLSRLYRQTSALVDISAARYIIEDDDVWRARYRAEVELHVPLLDRYDTVRSGWWPSLRGARRELLRMLRGACVGRDEQVTE